VETDEFTAFFHADYDPLVGFLCKLGYNRDIARDAAAEAMTALWKAWSAVTSPKAWVRTVALRTAPRMITKRPDTLYVSERVDDRARHAEIEEWPLVVALLRQLPDKQRMVMAWHLDGFTTIEIAEHIGIDSATVRSHLRHARTRLKALYAEQTTDPPVPEYDTSGGN
jgi:RNA polymerase sigma factor (sigma-70 family)